MKMITLVYVVCLVAFVHSGVITHDADGEDGIGGKATSYQSIHMEHFHAVPTYIKKEYKHLLEHPIPAGKSSSKVEIHHGSKHDHGYALVDSHNSARGSGHDYAGYGGQEDGNLGGHAGASLAGQGDDNLGEHGASSHLVTQALAAGGYQVHDQTQELLQQHQASQAFRGHGGLHLQALAALSHGGASLGHVGGIALDQYHAAAGSHQPIIIQFQQNDVAEEEGDGHRG